MNKPKIRFKEFEGEWEKTHLSDSEFSILAGGDVDKSIIKEKGRYPVIANALTSDGIIGYYDDYYRIKAPAVTVTGRGEIGHAQARHYNFTPVVRLLSISSIHNVDFLANAINRCNVAQESTGVPQLTTDKLKEYSFCIPFTSEQQAIASYFTHLDTLITASASRLTSLKQMKAASLQAMFPQEGETVPKIRFKGFEGEWEQVSLKDISTKVVEKNKSNSISVTLTNSAEYGIIDQRDFFDHDVSNIDNISGYFVVQPRDFVYNPRISALAPVGPINMNKLGYSGVMSPLYYVFRVLGINKDFLDVFFRTNMWHKYMKDNGNTGARFDRLSISDELFREMPIYCPKDINEQKKIASYFRSIDRQIDLQTQRLKKLKQIKAACLDKMFV